MAAVDLPESSVWHDVVQGVGAGDLASPGVGGPPNRAAQMLTDRTKWLKDQLKPEYPLILRQTQAQSVPAYAWTNLVYDTSYLNETGQTFSLPLEYILVPAGISEVQMQGGVALNDAVATKRVGLGMMTLVNDQAPVNGAVDSSHRYNFNFYPMASVKSGWIPVSAGDRLSFGIISSVSSVTLAPGTDSTIFCEILMR